MYIKCIVLFSKRISKYHQVFDLCVFSFSFPCDFDKEVRSSDEGFGELLHMEMMAMQ